MIWSYCKIKYCYEKNYIDNYYLSALVKSLKYFLFLIYVFIRDVIIMQNINILIFKQFFIDSNYFIIYKIYENYPKFLFAILLIKIGYCFSNISSLNIKFLILHFLYYIILIFLLLLLDSALNETSTRLF